MLLSSGGILAAITIFMILALMAERRQARKRALRRRK